MKRLYTMLALVVALAALALPAIARADGGPALSPAGWTWDES